MLIGPRDITVVLQGDIRSNTEAAIRSVRSVLPGARLVLSTFETEDFARVADDVDEIVLSPDPGEMPPFVKANDAAPNNTNRQLLSTQAGLKRAETPYALKMRTDCVLLGTGFVKLLEQLATTGANAGRLVVSSFFTRHPRGFACYLFHISDWFVFGETDRVKLFFSAPGISPEEATWFERHNHLKSGTYAARRFRARFTPEQHITTHFARLLGYRTPRFLNDVDGDLLREYRRFLANEVVVASPGQLNFLLEKYRHIDDSFYQKIDCLSLPDWCRIFQAIHGRKPLPDMGLRNQGLVPMTAVRYLANKFRHVIIRLMLGSRRAGKARSRKPACSRS